MSSNHSIKPTADAACFRSCAPRDKVLDLPTSSTVPKSWSSLTRTHQFRLWPFANILDGQDGTRSGRSEGHLGTPLTPFGTAPAPIGRDLVLVGGTACQVRIA
jgi:hypothetical protein